MGSRSPSGIDLKDDYRQYPAVTSQRVSQVATSYESLTGRKVYPRVMGTVAIIARIHGDQTESLMKKVYDAIGVNDLLRVLRETPRGAEPVIADGSRWSPPTRPPHTIIVTGVAPAPRSTASPSPAACRPCWLRPACATSASTISVTPAPRSCWPRASPHGP
jgi:hypothetical protein